MGRDSAASTKVSYGDEDDEEPVLNQIVKAGLKFYATKEIAGEFGDALSHDHGDSATKVDGGGKVHQPMVSGCKVEWRAGSRIHAKRTGKTKVK